MLTASLSACFMTQTDNLNLKPYPTSYRKNVNLLCLTRKRKWTYAINTLSASYCKFWNSWPIFTKLDTNIITLEVTAGQEILIWVIIHGGRAKLWGGIDKSDSYFRVLKWCMKMDIGKLSNFVKLLFWRIQNARIFSWDQIPVRWLQITQRWGWVFVIL